MMAHLSLRNDPLCVEWEIKPYLLTNAAVLFVVGRAAASSNRPGRYFNFESETGRASLQLVEIEVSNVGLL